ncbi:MAG: peptidoglycan glycosyltransferase, partial [Lachnospiraceae bacterium]|nr:peptidoglycan glycosyltransferase [Lachnospiraceae bacterium]
GREYGYLNDDSTLERTTKAAVDGNTIISTIDVNIQQIVEKHILAFNEEHKGEYREGELGSKNTGVIVMNPKTAEVLAMASYPVYDLNKPTDLSAYYTEQEIKKMQEEDAFYDTLNQLWKNFCIQDTYEPGSTAKSLTIAAALDSGKITGNEAYECRGMLTVSGHDIKCHKWSGHGVVDVSGALEQSCNVALMKIAATVGNETFMKYLTSFNMGLRTNIDLAGEGRTDTLIYNVDDMVASDLAISSFGQGYNVTMIQMATAFCSIINGGYYNEPHVVSEIRNSDGVTVKKNETRVLKQVISNEVSEKMRGYLAAVCTKGTGTTAVPSGYLIGGKTGTAETRPRKQGNYVVSFIGFAPVDDPQVMVYVVVDRPNVADQPHSTFAQELAKEIFTEVLPYMNIFRTEELSEEQIEELKRLNIIPGGTEDAEEEEGSGEEGDTGEGGSEGAPQEGEGSPDEEPQYETDPETGNLIDPQTGQRVDPVTMEYVDPTYSMIE